jgi:hypothetical protein
MESGSVVAGTALDQEKSGHHKKKVHEGRSVSKSLGKERRKKGLKMMERSIDAEPG